MLWKRVPADLDVLEWLDLVEAACLDFFTGGFASAAEVREKLDEAMHEDWPDRETWGDDGSNEAQAEAMQPAAMMVSPEEQEARRQRRLARQAQLAAATPTAEVTPGP